MLFKKHVPPPTGIWAKSKAYPLPPPPIFNCVHLCFRIFYKPKNREFKVYFFVLEYKSKMENSKDQNHVSNNCHLTCWSVRDRKICFNFLTKYFENIERFTKLKTLKLEPEILKC